MNVLDEIVADQIRTDLPELAAGDTVRSNDDCPGLGRNSCITQFRLPAAGQYRIEATTFDSAQFGYMVTLTHPVATIRAKPVLARDHCLAPDRIVDAPIYGGRYGRMFTALPPTGISIHVGPAVSLAMHRLRDSAATRAFLSGLLV